MKKTKNQSLRSRAIYKFYKLAGSPFDKSTSLTKQRAMIERQSKFAIMPSKIDVKPIYIERIYAEWLTPDKKENGQAVLYLHGGGYTMGSCSTHRALASRIALACRVPVLLVNYRLAPEHPFPTALEDAQTAYLWLLDQGLDAKGIAVAGDSSGGGLALSTVIALRDAKQPLPAAVVCISPWADLTMSGETIFSSAQKDHLISLDTSRLHASRYAGQHDLRLPLISPVFADLSGFPALLIQVGEHEILLSDSLRLSENSRRAGVDVTLEIWDGMWHVWHAYAGLMPESQRAIDRIGLFIQDRMMA